MNVRIHYRITKDSTGAPSSYTGARNIVIHEGETWEESAKKQLSAVYGVPQDAVEISRVEE